MQPTYVFTDRSLVRPLLTRLWFKPLFRLVPRWLAANFVTLLSFGCLLLVLGLALVPALAPAPLALAFAACQMIYVAGDHLDGMQAVASRTTSPLGDFLDHYCDLWGGGILIFASAALVGGLPPAVLYGMIALLILGFAITYVEREERRALHFTTLGALEANCILTAFLLSWTIGGVRAWWLGALPGGLPRVYLLVALCCAMALGVIVVIARRMERIPPTLGVFAASLAALAGVLSAHPEVRPVEGWLLLALLGGGYVGRVMRGYLLAGHRSRPDWVAGAATLALAAWSALGDPTPAALRAAAAALGAWLVLALAWSLADVLGSLRRHWVWINRPEGAAELREA